MRKAPLALAAAAVLGLTAVAAPVAGASLILAGGAAGDFSRPWPADLLRAR